jgi:hypothetical protein
VRVRVRSRSRVSYEQSEGPDALLKSLQCLLRLACNRIGVPSFDDAVASPCNSARLDDGGLWA